MLTLTGYCSMTFVDTMPHHAKIPNDLSPRRSLFYGIYPTYHTTHLSSFMSTASSSTTNELLRSAGITKDDDYARLSHYLQCALTSCGVDAIDPAATAYGAATADTARKVNILMLSTGKQFGLASLSYKTVFLDENGAQPRRILSPDEHARHVTVADAVQQYNLQLDPLLLGGMIPVSITHVMVCSLDWVRTFYAEPAKRLQESKDSNNTGGHRLGGATNDDTTTAASPSLVSDDDVRALFVRNSTAAAMEEDVRDMTSKLQDLIAAKRQAKNAAASNISGFTSFSGQGQSLDGNADTSSNAAEDGVVWDTQALPDTPAPPLDAQSKTTSIAVRLLNGKRQIVKLSVSNTVQDLAIHLKQAIMVTTTTAGGDIPWMNEKFRLVGGYPPKPVTHANATIQDAGLTGAQVTMKTVQ